MAWGVLADVTGHTGATGPTGSAGSNGSAGSAGATGATGPTGANSTVAGPTGATGPAGSQTPTVKTTTYTAVVGDFVEANATSAGFTVTLPNNPASGSIVSVKKTDSSANVVTVAPQGGATIDGDANATIVTQNAGATFIYDGTLWRVLSPTLNTGTQGPVGATGSAGSTGATGSAGASGPGRFVGSISGVLAVRTGTVRMYNDSGRTLTIASVRTTCGVAPTGATILVDVNKNGTTIFTTQGNRPSIAISGVASSKATPDVTSLADGDYLTVDIDQVGSTLPGTDLLINVEVS